MNEITRPTLFTPNGPPAQLPTTQAAEGYPRMRWTIDRFEQLIETGILTEQDRVELVDGEMLPMASKGNRHENVRGALQNWMIRRLPENLLLFSEPGWRPGGDHYLEPDLLLAEAGTFASDVPPAKVVLIVEVAKTSLEYDIGLKSRTYAALGVRDYWVVNAVTLETRVFREPDAAGYAKVGDVAPGDLVTPHLVPELALRLSDLQLG